MARPKGVPDISDFRPFVWLALPNHQRKTGAGRFVWLAIWGHADILVLNFSRSDLPLHEESQSNDIRKRLSRFIDTGSDIRDLERIFQWARFPKMGKFPAVEDIGHYLAHKRDKCRGVTFDVSSDFKTSFAFHTLPEERISTELFKESAMAVFRMEPIDETKKVFRRSRAVVLKQLKSAIGKVQEFKGGQIYAASLTRSEKSALLHYSSRLVVRPAYTQKSLASQFAECMITNNIALREQKSDIIAQSNRIALFALEAMHGALLKISTQEDTRFILNFSEGNLGILARSPISGLPNNISTSFSVFQTDLGSEYLGESLTDPKINQLHPDQPIEISRDWLVELL